MAADKFHPQTPQLIHGSRLDFVMRVWNESVVLAIPQQILHAVGVLKGVEAPSLDACYKRTPAVKQTDFILNRQTLSLRHLLRFLSNVHG